MVEKAGYWHIEPIAEIVQLLVQTQQISEPVSFRAVTRSNQDLRLCWVDLAVEVLGM